VDIEGKSPNAHHRRDKAARRTTCIKNVKLKVCKILIQFYYRENLNWATKPSTGPHAARGLDIAGIEHEPPCELGRTIARKFSIGGLDFLKFDKNSTDL